MEVKEYINSLMEKAKAAQAIFEGYNQEQVDRVVRAIGLASYNAADELCAEAIEETKKGRLDSKIMKHRRTALNSWFTCKGKKSVGMIEWDPVGRVAVYGKPAGIVACVTPTTNPTSTPVHNAMHSLKARNAVIVAAHPGAKKSTFHSVQVMRDALAAEGAPVDLIQAIEPEYLSLEATQYLMSSANVVIATGGAGMVRAAYSSGKPAFGVGQGNVQDFIGEDWQDYAQLAELIVGNRTYDYGMPCTCDQHVHVPASKFDLLVEELTKRGGFLITDEGDIQKLREALFDAKGVIMRDCVGVSAAYIANKAGIEIPKDTVMLMVETSKYAYDELLAKEIMAPLVRLRRYTDIKDAVRVGKANYLMEGAGHSGAVFSNDQEVIDMIALEIPTCRLMVNQTANAGTGGPYNNGLPHTVSLGCGFWGGNSISENLTFKNLMNYTRVSYIIPDAHMYTPEEIWGE